MPGGDGSGPEGRGPMTGRAAGYCAGTQRPGYANLAPGSGAGMGRGGGGWGRRNVYRATGIPGRMRSGGFTQIWNPAPAVELDEEAEGRILRNRAQALRSELDVIESRLSGMESEGRTD